MIEAGQSDGCDNQLKQLIEQEVRHICGEKVKIMQSQYDELYERNMAPNAYFDKQLAHLVISEEFNFEAISALLTEAFQNSSVDTSEQACRIRWTFLHENRENMASIKEQEKQQKRIKSVAAFSNPYSLYSVDELIQNLEKQQKDRQLKNEWGPKAVEPSASGYNIFKDSFRRVQNMEEYSELEAKMKQALKKAQEEVYQEHPMYFTPEYSKLEQFEVKGEELTAEKAKQLLSFQIEMEKVSREMTINKQNQEQQKYERLIRERIENEQKGKKVSNNADLEDNWDEYDSD